MTDMQIQCFLTLAENLNYTKTAQVMGIAQSTLSAHISALEKALNHTLFVRTKRTVVLSTAGEIMYKTFKDAVAIVEDAVQRINQMEQENRNRITIGLMEGQWSKTVIEKMSADFFQDRDQVQFCIKTYGNAELLEQLDLGTVDMILGYETVLSVRPDLRGVPLYESPFYIAKRAGFPKSLLDDKSLLESQRFILQDKKCAPFAQKHFEAFCQLYEVVPGNILRVENTASVMLNVEMGRGIGFIDDLSIIYGKNQYEFEVIKGYSIKYDLIYKTGHTKTLLQEYIDYLKNAYSERTLRSTWSAGF